MSKVQLKDINGDKNVYPVTKSDYVEGIDDKFKELNTQDETDIKELKDKVNILENKEDKDTIYDDTYIKQQISNIKILKADKTWVLEEITKIATGGEIDLSDYVTFDKISDMATITLVNKLKSDLINGASVDYQSFGDIEYQLKKKLDSSSLDNYPTKDEVTQQIIDITTDGKIDLTGYATEVWVKGMNYISNDMMIPITLDEYNKLEEDGTVNREAWYYIVDNDYELFNKVMELSKQIEEMEKTLKEVNDFKNMFPIDNRTYAIINQQPKDLSAVFPNELGIPTDIN